MKKSKEGAMPLAGRLPSNPEWVLLRTLADDLSPVIDNNDRKVLLDIAEKRDFDRYDVLDSWWGLRSINPTVSASTISRNAALYLSSSFLKKWVEPDGEQLLVEKTLDKFFHYERHCYEYNKDGYRQLSWSDDPKIQLFFSRMQQFIADILGPLNTRALLKHGRHGPGRTYSLSARYGHRFHKTHRYPYEVTADAVVLARQIISSDMRWVDFLEASFTKPFSEISNDELFHVVPGNLVLFVPKSRKILRTIACEPVMNVYIQLAVDSHIRQRLKRRGVNLDDQRLNQLLAYQGSLNNSLSTLDLEGASATVTCKIVEKLFPREWYDLLFSLRCDQGELPDGTIVRYQQLSSMGNGYTFAVESLIFAAMVYSIGGDLGNNSAVYGDDIIVPTSLVSDLTRLISACGFLINTEKSFFCDTFTRESCGTDYENGYNIRPVFLKKSLSVQNAFEVFSLHNKLLKWFHTFVGPETPKVCELLQTWMPSNFCIWGPPKADDLSSYFASPCPVYSRTKMTGYRYKRAVAVSRDHLPKIRRKVKDTCNIQDEHYDAIDWLNNGALEIQKVDLATWLNHDLKDTDTESGTRFTVSVRDDYLIRVQDGWSCVFDWPLTY